MRRILKRLITPPLLVVAGVFFVVEELLWKLSAVFAAIGKLPVFRRVEAWIRGLPPYGALALFGVPTVALAPIKLLALYWLAGGHPSLGIGLILTAKVVGTAFVAYLFRLTQPALVTIGWFAWCYERVLMARMAVHDWWMRMPMVRWVGMKMRQIRERFRRARASWLANRWAAIRLRLRRSS